MRKLLFIILCILGFVGQVHAVPAHWQHIVYTQSDGSTVTLQLHGDEFLSFTTTVDGYTVVRTDNGDYTYATTGNNGQLVSTGVTAHDANSRNSQEVALLEQTQAMLRPAMTTQQKEMRKGYEALISTPYFTSTASEPKKLFGDNARHMKKGLVILVEFTDAKFSRTDANSFYSRAVNEVGYNGYITQGPNPQTVTCTGSIRDYFADNSAGQFTPEFDVVGPITINHSCYAGRDSANYFPAYEILPAIDNQVDFSQYDADNDGKVDMFYIIYAGKGSNFVGNNSGYVWPFASQISSMLTLDGKKFGRYACGVEIFGWEQTPSSLVIDGIGTMVHEFSHVLSLPDLYDTNYENGGQSLDPQRWSVMAGGSYLNNSRTPAGYGIYERYASGVLMPVTINAEQSFTMGSMQSQNKGYRISAAVPNEFFLLENRQKEKWDEYLPGHGMLVWHVDSTNKAYWESNIINVNPNHNYMHLERANGRTTADSGLDNDSDPFPGSDNVTEITNETTPNLMSFYNAPTSVTVHNIAENNGIISFTTQVSPETYLIEDFEAITPFAANATGVKGVFTDWDFTNCYVIAPADTVGFMGSHAVGIKRNAVLTTSVIEDEVVSLSFDFYNAGTSNITLRTSISTDNGATWKVLTESNGGTNTVVASKKQITANYVTGSVSNAMYRIQNYSGGSNSTLSLVDNVTLLINNKIPETLMGDVNGDGTIDVADVNAIIDIILNSLPLEAVADMNGDGVIDVADVAAVIDIILQ